MPPQGPSPVQIPPRLATYEDDPAPSFDPLKVDDFTLVNAAGLAELLEFLDENQDQDSRFPMIKQCLQEALTVVAAVEAHLDDSLAREREMYAQDCYTLEATTMLLKVVDHLQLQGVSFPPTFQEFSEAFSQAFPSTPIPSDTVGLDVAEHT